MKLTKRIISILCVLSMMLTSWGDTMPRTLSVSPTLTRELTASDGNSYLVTVACAEDSGIPEDAVLQVTELTGSGGDRRIPGRGAGAAGYFEGL